MKLSLQCVDVLKAFYWDPLEAIKENCSIVKIYCIELLILRKIKENDSHVRISLKIM